jgi:heme exporter protein A
MEVGSLRGLLEAEGLAAFRGERLVFSDLSLRVPEGGALLLVGPNGSGKSTLLRLLAGLVRPEAGRLTWRGADAFEDPVAHAGRVAYVGHLDALKPGLTTAENLRFWGKRDAVAAALVTVGLAALADLPARMLSAGQRRRLALARLALSPAPIWLLDEPTLGLDVASVARLGGLLAGHRTRGGVVVAATHLALPLEGAEELSMSESSPLPLREGLGEGDNQQEPEVATPPPAPPARGGETSFPIPVP